MNSIGKGIPHDSAWGHVTGTALYVDDMRPAVNEVFVDAVGARVAKGEIVSIDVEAARRISGVVGIFTHKDVPGDNKIGAIVHDENFLAFKEITFVGEPVVLIAATSRQALREAKKAVKINVKEQKPILTIDEAIAAEQFIGPRRIIERGDVEAVFRKAESPVKREFSPHPGPLPKGEREKLHTLEGTFISGGQDHFYLESQAAIAYPGEEGQMVVQSSTQNPTEVQAVVAHVLGLRMNQVVCICKRMGGGFGGKETQAAFVAAAAALVASKLNRPARVVYSKDDDMKFTGKRHEYKSNYKVAFDDDGRMVGLKINFYSNGGCSTDLSLAVMERTLLHSDNAYYIANAQITGQVCKTNLPSNTAFRGFGGPQAVAAIENIMEEIAAYLQKDAYDVRVANCYGIGERNVTPYGQLIENNLLPEIFAKIAQSSDYRKRREAVAKFNATSKTHLRGLSMTAVKFGISFTKKHLNQGNALVNVYTDGTVQVSTGGTEMGQGLNTKIKQLVADVFSIDVDDVILMPTSTEKNNNTSPTAASASTDLNGTAAVRAAEKIRNRVAEFAAGSVFADLASGIEPSPSHVVFADGVVYDSRTPERQIAFTDLILKAHFERVDLGERGFYATPGVDYNRDTGKGHPFLYYTTGAAIAEVVIDRLTGEMHIDRIDLLMDIGKSINPLVDRGQVVGGFVQGMGWCTTEELKYSEKGELLSYSPTTYKIPNIGDIPAAFNVDFIANEANVRNVAASKAVGEPPLLLGICAWAAVKDALRCVGEGRVELNLPATGEEILMRLTERLEGEAPSEPLASVDGGVDPAITASATPSTEEAARPPNKAQAVEVGSKG